MKIAICDDEKVFANDIKTKVENFMYKNRIESDIHTFYCSETFEDDSFYDIATSDSDFASVFAHDFLRASKVCIRLCTRVVGDFKCTKLCCTALLEWMVCLKG